MKEKRQKKKKKEKTPKATKKQQEKETVGKDIWDIDTDRGHVINAREKNHQNERRERQEQTPRDERRERQEQTPRDERPRPKVWGRSNREELHRRRRSVSNDRSNDRRREQTDRYKRHKEQ